MKTKISNFTNQILKILTITMILIKMMASSCFAVEEVNGGGSIQSRKIGTGVMNMVKDLTGTLQWIIPTAGVMVILFYVFKIMTRRRTRSNEIQKNHSKSISLYHC